jgi:hypothetical protein
MSTNPYPDMSGDESGLVPPQSGRSPEWPKKIRTLTAAELDRLTIDRDGRFYWDGKPVSFEPPASPVPPSPPPAPPQEATSAFSERSALEILERAALEIGDRKPPEPIESVEPIPPVDSFSAQAPAKPIDLDQVVPSAAPLATTAAPAAAVQRSEIIASMEDRPAMIAPTIRTTERVRLSLSFWQSLGIILMLLSVLAGAWGIAALGLVTAHDWGCRIGVVNHYCPPSPVKPPVRSDIPA